MPTSTPLPQFKVEVYSPPKITPSGGKLYWYENFPRNQQKFLQTAGTISLTNTANQVRTGAYGLRIATAGGGGPFIGTADCTTIGTSKELITGKIGLECYMSPYTITTAAAGMVSCNVRLRIDDGTLRRDFGVQMVHGATAADAKLQYLDSTNAWADIPGATYTASEDRFYRVKIVVDMNNLKYVRVEFQTESFDLSGISCYSVAAATHLSILTFNVTGQDATTTYLHAADMSITYDEP